MFSLHIELSPDLGKFCFVEHKYIAKNIDLDKLQAHNKFTWLYTPLQTLLLFTKLPIPRDLKNKVLIYQLGYWVNFYIQIQ